MTDREPAGRRPVAAGGCDGDGNDVRRVQELADDLPANEEEWRKRLGEARFRICRRGGTEPPFSGALLHERRRGHYHCAACGAPLFTSDAKFDSGCGWPSFFMPIGETAIRHLEDDSLAMLRIEIRCARCDSHLGHVFEDGPPPTGQRYCVNSLSLVFHPVED